MSLLRGDEIVMTLVERVKELVHIIDELANSKELEDNYELVGDTYKILENLEYEDILIIQSIMYIGRQERKPDPSEFSNYYAYEEELERYNPERMLKYYMNSLGANYESPSIRIHNMLAKRPLMDYLQKGLNLIGVRHEIKQVG
jgi:hypothetical protein